MLRVTQDASATDSLAPGFLPGNRRTALMASLAAQSIGTPHLPSSRHRPCAGKVMIPGNAIKVDAAVQENKHT
jgi:hypothetical protein